MADYSVEISHPTLNGIDGKEIGVMAGAAIFLCLSCWHGGICAGKKSWCSWGLGVAAILEFFNLLAYAYSLERPRHMAILIFGAFFRWTGPYLMFLSLVQIFGRVAWSSTGRDQRKIDYFWGFLRWNTSIFFILHIVAFGIEMVGSIETVMTTRSKDTPGFSGGRVVVVIGLVLQLLVIIAFSTIVARFRAMSTNWDVDKSGSHKRRNWKALLTALFACYLLSIALQAVKIALCFIKAPESLLYASNSVTLLVVFVVIGVIHPYRCLPASMTCFSMNKSRVDLRSKHPSEANERKLPQSSSGSEASLC